MNPEYFTNYWIGQEPTGPGHSPTLNQMPAYVDVAPLAFVGITEDDQLSFDFLTQQNSAETIQGWIKDVRAQGTKVLLSINSQQFASIQDPSSFAQTVKNAITEWGVDGIDIDYEPPSQSPTLITVVKELRTTLGSGTIMTAPVYSSWLGMLDFLGEFAESLDYLTTMDYTGYPGFDQTIKWFNQYAGAIGGPEKLAIGISCMGPSTGPDFTPLQDVINLCQWEPSKGQKQGAMLYTFSYDIKVRPIPNKPTSGTGYPNGTWTQTIHENLPVAARISAAS